VRVSPTAQRQVHLQPFLKVFSFPAAKELAIFQRFSGSNQKKEKKSFPSVKLNAYTPSNPEKKHCSYI